MTALTKLDDKFPQVRLIYFFFLYTLLIPAKLDLV